MSMELIRWDISFSLLRVLRRPSRLSSGGLDRAPLLLESQAMPSLAHVQCMQASVLLPEVVIALSPMFRRRQAAMQGT